MNKKLKIIYSMIEHDWTIIADIGCDHAFLSLNNYIKNDNKKFINVDNKIGPLENGKSNHLKVKNNAEFILSDGRDFLKNNKIDIDCCIIAGIGGINCLEIVENDTSYIKNYILQVDNNQVLIDDWIINNKYHVKEINFLDTNKKKYSIYKITKNYGKEYKG